MLGPNHCALTLRGGYISWGCVNRELSKAHNHRAGPTHTLSGRMRDGNSTLHMLLVDKAVTLLVWESSPTVWDSPGFHP